MTAADEHLAAMIEYLTATADLHRKMGSDVRRSREALILEHGRLFTGVAAFRDGFDGRRYRRGECYSNALKLCLDSPDDSLVYCEGYALSVIPVHHAWTVGRYDGLVRDPTWDAHDNPVYLGLPLETKWVCRRVIEQDAYTILSGVLDADALLANVVTGVGSSR